MSATDYLTSHGMYIISSEVQFLLQNDPLSSRSSVLTWLVPGAQRWLPYGEQGINLSELFRHTLENLRSLGGTRLYPIEEPRRDIRVALLGRDPQGGVAAGSGIVSREAEPLSQPSGYLEMPSCASAQKQIVELG